MEHILLTTNIITQFNDWYLEEGHSLKINSFSDFMNEEKIRSLPESEFIEFFYKFVETGGEIQSGGHRLKNKFKEYIKTNFSNFKCFVIEPFSKEFSVEKWFTELEKHKYFGVGIATIYLNRVDKNKYSVMNNKTLKALRALQFDISLTKNIINYKKIVSIQQEIISNFPTMENLYKCDSLNHFLVGTQMGKQIILDIISKKAIEDNLEQTLIENEFRKSSRYDDKDFLLKSIDEIQKEKLEYTTSNSKRVRRNNYLMVLIKKYRGFKCQFCLTSIKKEGGGYYIEACHIKAKSDGGKDRLDNILILCPNCHKLLDYAERKKIKSPNSEYIVKLNGNEYKAKLV